MFSGLAYSVHRALVLIGTVYSFFLARIFDKYVQFRGKRQVLCPETGGFATIRIDALHAAVSSPVDDPELHVTDCSRWPERQECGQECVLRTQ